MHTFQPKPKTPISPPKTPLTPDIRPAGDLWEQEADKIADRVATSSFAVPIQHAAPRPRAEAVLADPALSAPAKPLDAPLRHDMEHRIGHDFSRVRVHIGPAADQSARNVNAQAYTVGNDIVFAAGRFAPATAPGRRLLAHELTHVVQQARGSAQVHSLTLQRVPAQTAPAPTKEDNLSPLRQELFKLFPQFEEKVIGDDIYEKVETKKHWDEMKKKEADYETAKNKYVQDLEKFKKGEIPKAPEEPEVVHKMTTCIAAQQEILKEAFQSAGLGIKKIKKEAHYEFGTTGPQNAKAIGDDAWRAADRNMKQRPKKGDIYVLAKRGSKVDKAAKDLFFVQGAAPAKIAKSAAANEKAQAALQSAEEVGKHAQETLAALDEAQTSQTSAAYLKAKSSLSFAISALGRAKKKAADAQTDLGKSKNQVSEYTEKLQKARLAVDHTKFFDFSHVGFIQAIVPRTDGSALEDWWTFDGGQIVLPRDNKEGAQTNHRVYDPATNEISGEKQQGGEARWLQGWVDVDKLPQGT